MLPFSVATEDGPIYVNPKQYHGILRRRKIRAKEGLQKRSAKDKPYLHESRHRHACRRPRGAGGRFLNTKSLENEKSEHEKKKTSGQQAFPSSQAQSSSSEVLQSESVNFYSPNKVSDSKTSTFSGSEVTSMYYSKEFDCFRVSSARPFAFHPLSSMEASRQGTNWVTAADGCCDFFKVWERKGDKKGSIVLILGSFLGWQSSHPFSHQAVASFSASIWLHYQMASHPLAIWKPLLLLSVNPGAADGFLGGCSDKRPSCLILGELQYGYGFTYWVMCDSFVVAVIT